MLASVLQPPNLSIVKVLDTIATTRVALALRTGGGKRRALQIQRHVTGGKMGAAGPYRVPLVPRYLSLCTAAYYSLNDESRVAVRNF